MRSKGSLRSDEYYNLYLRMVKYIWRQILSKHMHIFSVQLIANLKINMVIFL